MIKVMWHAAGQTRLHRKPWPRHARNPQTTTPKVELMVEVGNTLGIDLLKANTSAENATYINACVRVHACAYVCVGM